MPKKSKISKFKYASLPKVFLEDLKKNCIFRENVSNFEQLFGVKRYDESLLHLNRLESYLLKIVIPFIRVAHCPRGPYLKVKGDLILISADLDHSMSKVLPVTQNLIPVCFKRKLAYSGSYIEEFVERKKVELYFKWYKKYNHLFKKIQFDDSIVQDFISDTMQESKEFEELTIDSDKLIVPEENEEDFQVIE